MSDKPSIDSIFCSAIEIESPDERQAYVEQACGDGMDLRHQVERLLQAHFHGRSILDAPAVGPVGSGQEAGGSNADLSTAACQPPTAAEAPGTLIGPYKLLEQIGEGGMGTVWMAQQTEPVRRVVAVKLIKPGMDSKQVLARFEAERQALALMDHPNIARVLDGGTTDAGRPYFVMDLVKGVPITKYCDEHHLTPRQRLELFLPVCLAVQHAHQKGIIHRDIKPSNILVAQYDGRPVPKVIDFGVAKAAGQQLTEQTLVTGFGNIVGTLEYMSPEQAELNQLDIDTRSDIYSLGVVLYELLTGSTPLDKKQLKQAAFAELLRIIREQEPQKPSTRLSSTDELPSVAAQRHTEPAKLTKLVRGELDWIVMKALEKDRNRRYETANSFAMDIQRYLADEAVQACPPSYRYRLRKFARRNRRVVATGSAVGLAALVAVAVLVTSTVLIARALRSETKAKDDLADALEREQQDAYFHRIALAHRELSAYNLRRARELLNECPERLRDWEWHFLARLCQVDPLIIRDTTEVNSLAFGRGGEWIASACGDGTLKIWDSKTGKLVRRIPNAHERFASSVAFHPDGNHLASVGWDNLVKVWDLTTDPPRQVFCRPCDAVRPMGTAYAVAFRPGDGRYLAAGSDGAVKLWDWQNDRLEHRFAGHGRIPISVAFSRDGRWLASGDWQGRIKLWDPDARSEAVHTFTESISPISALAFGPDASELATASYDRRVDVWNTKTGEHLRPIPHIGRRAVTGVAYSLNGRLLATSGEDKTVHVREAATGRELLGLRGHTGTVTCLTFSPDGQRLVSAGKDRTIRVWDGTPLRGDEGQEEARTFMHHANEIWSLAVRPTDGRMVVSAGFRTSAMVWDPQSGRVITEIPGQSAVVFCVAWSPDGELVASAGVTETAEFNLKVVNPQDPTRDFELQSKSEFMAVAFDPGSKHLVTGQQDGTVRVWDVRTHLELGKVGAHMKAILGIAFSPDGSRLASMSMDGEIKLWDAKRLGERHFDGKAELRVAPMRARSPGACLNLAFSPDGRFLASGGEEYTVKIWDVEKGGEPVTILRGHKEDIYAVAFSPDGRWLASAGEDTTVRVLDCRAGYALARIFRGHNGLVNSLAFSPDSQQLFSGSNDYTVKVWNMTQLNDRPDP